MLFVDKIPEFSSLLLEEAKAIIALSLFFVSFEEKGYYCVVSVGQFIFDCRSNCGLNLRMQGSRN